MLYSEIGHYSLADEVVEDTFVGQNGNQALTKSFFLGAKILSKARAGKLDQAENLINENQSTIRDINFFARMYYQLALCYLTLAQEDYPTVIQRTKKYLHELQSTDVEYLLPELFVLISKAQIALALWDDAESTLREARIAVDKLGSRRSQWQVEYLLGQCALKRGDQKQTAEHFEKSKETLAYILDHISNDDLKDHFLNREDVKQVLDVVVEIS
jgi:hypothetical protein